MALVRKNPGGADDPEAPKGNHLMVGVGTGQWVPIPEKALMAISEDAKDPDKFIVLRLKKVSRHEIIFDCPCGNKECTLEFAAKRIGRHAGEMNLGRLRNEND